MDLSVQPGEFGSDPVGLNARISGGVVYSFPGQKGQNPPFFFCEGETKSVGLFPRSTEIITHLPTIGSFLSSGIVPPITEQNEHEAFYHRSLYEARTDENRSPEAPYDKKTGF
jgi:hypothetical protein